MATSTGFIRRVCRDELRALAQDMSQAELARHYGVASGTILHALKKFDIKTRGHRKVLESEALPLPPSPDLALLIGAVLGDGCITQLPRCQRLDIACFEEQTEWIDTLRETIHSLLGKRTSLYFPPARCIHIRIHMQGISALLNIPAGNKIRNQLRIPRWVYSSTDYLVPCLRALFETDGCFVARGVDHVYMVEFTNLNRGLLEDCRSGLSALGFHPQIGAKYVRLARITEVRAFCEMSGFLKADMSRIPESAKRTQRKGDMVECALQGCDRLVYRPPGDSQGRETYCSRAHAGEARRKVERPTKEELLAFLTGGQSWSALGRQFGVSDNAVRKWAKTYGLIL